MANYDLGTARGTIELEYKGDGPQKAQRDLDDLTSKSDRTSAAYDRVGGTMQKAGAAIGAGIGLAIKSAADFEQKMSAIKAVSGASGQEMEQLGQKAMQLGKDTSFSASEAASAIEELVKAGVSVPDVMNGAADATVALAEAGQINLKDAATVMSDVMNQFKMDAQELPHVADALAGAANASSASVQDLGEAFKYVGPVAKSAGMSFDDTNLALAVLAQNGIRGSEAGTGLRGVLAGLTPTTDKQREAFKQLGLITKDGSNIFYDANGKLKPFTEIIGILRDKTANLSDEEKKTFYEGAFGRNAWPVISALVNTTGAEFSDMAKRIGEVKAADVAAQRMDNFKGSLEKLKGSLETLMIQIGTPLLKAFTDLADGINTVVGWFLKLPPAVQAAGAQFAIFASGLLIAGGTIMKAIAFVAEFKTALATLGIIEKVGGMLARFLPALAAFATGPWGIAIAAVVAIGTALYELYKHNEKFKAFVDGLWASIKDIALMAFTKLKEGVQALVDGFNGVTTATGFIGFLQDVGAAARTFWDALKELWAVWQQTIWPMLKDAGSQIWQALKQAWIEMKPALSDLWAALKELWVALAPLREPIIELIGLIAKIVAGIVIWTTKMNLETIVALIKLAAVIAETVLPPLIKFVTFILKEIIPAIASWITKTVEIVTKIVEFVTAVIDGFTKAKDAVVSTVTNIVTKIGEIFTKIQDVINQIKIIWNAFWGGELNSPVTNSWRAIQEQVRLGIEAVKAKIDEIVAAIKLAWENFWNGVRDFLAPIWESIKSVVQTGINNSKAILDQVLAAIKAAWDAFWNLFGPPVQAAWDLIKSIVQLAIAAVQLAIVTGTNAIKTAWTTVWTAIKDFIGPIWEQIKTAVTTAVNAVKTALDQAWAAIKSAAELVWNTLKTSATTIWTAIKDAIVNVINTAKTTLDTAWQTIKTAAEGVWNALRTSATSIWNAIKTAIEGPINAVKGVLDSAWNAIKSAAESVWNAIKSAATTIWNAIKDAIVRPMNDAKTAVSGPINEIKRIIDDAWNAVKQKTTEIWTSLSKIVSDEAKKIVDAARKIKDDIVNFFKDAGNWLLDAGKNLVQGFINGITAKIHELDAKVKELTDKVKNATQQQLSIKSPSKVFFQYGEFTVQGYIDGFDSLIGKAKALIDKFVGMVKEAVASSKGLQLGSPSKIFFQYGNFTIQGFIDGLDSLMPDVQAKVKELIDLVKTFVQEKLKLGSPSKVFHEFGVDTIKGFINGMREQMPEIRKVIGELRDHFPEVKAIVKDAAQSIRGDLSSINLEQSISDIVSKLKPFSETLQNLNVQDHIKEIADKLQPVADKIKNFDFAGGLKSVADKMQPVVDKIKSMDIATPLQRVASKLDPVIDHLREMVSHIKGINIEGSLSDLAARLKPLAPTIKGMLGSGDLQGLANLVPQVAPGLPPITVNPAQVNGVFPDKIVLRVGDQEFNAYVDGRADQLMSRAASLLSRGRK